MKNIALAILFALSACGDDTAATPPDAAPAADAAYTPDASLAPAGGGCMGNLPNSRTITIANGDPIPAALLNELQDQAVGARRGQFIRRWQPCIYFSSSPTFWSLAQNPSGVPAQFPPVLKSASTSSVTAYFYIPYEPGEIISAWSVNFFGDGAITPSFQMLYSSAMGSAASSPSIISPPAVSASWHTFSDSGFTQALADGGALYFAVSTLSASTANNYLGQVSATFTH